MVLSGEAAHTPAWHLRSVPALAYRPIYAGNAFATVQFKSPPAVRVVTVRPLPSYLPGPHS